MKRMGIISVMVAMAVLPLATGCINHGGSKGGKNLAERASGDMEAYESTAVNAIEQARPSIMVIPGDRTLQNFKMISTEKTRGREYVIRDYQGYLLKDYRAKPVISYIQDAFNKQGYPLNDFEQTLKQLHTQEAMDLADGLEKDAKTLLLATARPDIILELNYYSSKDKGISLTGHDYGNKGDREVSYTLDAIDAYTNKVISSIGTTGLSGKSTTKTLQTDLNKKLPALQKEIVDYFRDILTRGREITVRVAVEKGSNVNLSNESIEGDTYADWIIDYMKTHTVKGAYSMQRNTKNDLSFVNCRIRLLNEDGTQYSAYDWARDLQKNLRTNLGLKVRNESQGLGEVLLVIQGIQ